MNSEFRSKVEPVIITRDLEFTIGYSVKPGIDLRFPETSIPVTEVIIRIVNDEAFLILKTDDQNGVCMLNLGKGRT